MKLEHAKEEITEGTFEPDMLLLLQILNCAYLNPTLIIYCYSFIVQFISMGVLLRTSVVCHCPCLAADVLGVRTRSESREANGKICQKFCTEQS